MTRWMRPSELDRQRESDKFDPAVEGERWGLSREVALAIWELICADASDSIDQRDKGPARKQFHELAARIAARGGLMHPAAGRVTRVGLEVDGSFPAAWVTHERRPGVPGRETRVAVEARSQLTIPSAPGRRTLVGDATAGARLGFDDYRVLALQELLHRLAGSNHALRQDTIVAAASTDRSIAGRATLWLEQLPSATMQTPKGDALWQAAERRAATLYRRAVGSGLVDTQDPAVDSAMRRLGLGQRLPLKLRRAMERELGVDLAEVRVHTDAVAAQAARALGAEAFTIGEDVFFADGMFAPDTRSGRQLLAHELAHVAQSLRGRTGPAGDGLRVSQPAEQLEQEADAVAAHIDGSAMDTEAEGDEPERSAEEVRRVARAGLTGAGGPLPHLATIQRSFGPGHDLSGVTAHVGGAAAQAAAALGARAYASGGAVAFSGTPDLHLAAHEAAHLVQQRAGIQFSRGMGEVGDVHERNADAIADRVVAGQPAADLLPRPGGASVHAQVQRRIQIGGTTLNRAAVNQTANRLVRVQLRDLATRPALERLVRETVRELDASSDTHAFGTVDALAANVRQRVLASQYMRRSQGTTPRSMAFSYPDSRLDGTVGVDPKVNDAAVSYWGPRQGD